jgi:hypothetical protein
MLWDVESERYYIKLTPKSKVKTYINDARSKKKFKPSAKYLKAIEDLLKKETLRMIRRCFHT